MKVIKTLWINILHLVARFLSAIGSWLVKCAAKLATYAEDKNSKWFYEQAYILGSETEISDSIREGKDLPIKQIAIVADGGEYYLAYDYEMHKVRELKKTRVYKTQSEAYESIKGFIKVRNTAKVTVDEASETATLEIKAEPYYHATTVTTVTTVPAKKGNGKRHIKHDYKQNKKQLKKGNGNYKKQPQTKKKVAHKAGK